MGRGTRSDTTASAPLVLRRAASGGPRPAWLSETVLGDELRAVVVEVFEALREQRTPGPAETDEAWRSSLVDRVAAAAVPQALASARRCLHAAGLAAVDPTAQDGLRMDPGDLQALRHSIEYWCARAASTAEEAYIEVIEEARGSTAATLARQVEQRGLQQPTLRLLLPADELAEWRAEFRVDTDDEVMEHEDWTAFYQSVLDGQDARSALEESLSLIAVVG